MTLRTAAKRAAACAMLGALSACAPAAVTIEEPAPPAAASDQFGLPPATRIETAPLPGVDLPQEAADAAAVAGPSAAPNPRAFAGRWQASDGGDPCAVVLTSGAPQADGSRLASASGCAGSLQGATGWRLGERSIDIVGPSGVLATLGEGGPGTLTGGGVTLVR